MPPPGGTTRTFGANPMAFGIPAGRHPPVIFDMATTAMAMNRVQRAAAAGQSVPDGWIADSKGAPTNDPSKFVEMRYGRPETVGLMLSIGSPDAGYKGIGLAMMVDVLAGVLTGAAFARDVKLEDSNIGQFSGLWTLACSCPSRSFRIALRSN